MLEIVNLILRNAIRESLTNAHKLLPVGVPHVVIMKLSSVSLAHGMCTCRYLVNSDQSGSRSPHKLTSALDKVQAEPCKTSRHVKLPDEIFPLQE